VRFRREHLWLWDDDGNVLLVTPFTNLRIVERVDVDAASSDEHVVELLDINAAPVETAAVQQRIAGVTSVKLEISKSSTYARAFILEGDDDDLPAALANARWHAVRRQGAAITTAP